MRFNRKGYFVILLLFGILSIYMVFAGINQGRGDRVNEKGTIVEQRFIIPSGFQRKPVNEDSFAFYLRTLPLKPIGSKVKYYSGETKTRDVYEAVVDMEIGTRDLQQCADAIMRLRGEYLYQQKRYDEITFNFTNGFKADYSRWMKGERISVKGNKVSWYSGAKPSNAYSDFRKYMDMVFIYAGTISLSKSLKLKKLEDMQIGDVLIQGGSPGHAVVVVDMAENAAGEKIFILAQSYMPAQDIQILKNPNEGGLSPWYRLQLGKPVITPEWKFESDDLKGF